MITRRNLLGAAALVLLAGSSGLARAALQAGRDFRQLSRPLESDAGAKIDVTEFFWYGCSHCHDLEPILDKWSKKMPGDVAVRRVPAVFHERWAPGAKLFYTLESLGQLPRLHREVFNAIHVQRLSLNEEKVLFDWIEKNGIDRKKFQETYGSFAVQTKVGRAQQLTRASGIEGVPAIIVDGRYQAIGGRNYDEMMGIVDELIEKARGERAARK